MAKSLHLLGDNCAQVGISAEAIVSGRELPVLPCSLITKGIVYELSTFRSKCDYLWDNFYEWLMKICKDDVPQTLPCVKASLSRLSKKRSELSRNKHRQQIADLFKEPFFPHRNPLKPSELENGALESVVDPAPVSKPSLSVRNVNKRLKRRDEKVWQYKSDIADLSKENQVL